MVKLRRPHLGGRVPDGVHQLVLAGGVVQLQRVLVQVEVGEGLYDPLGVVHLYGELLVSEVEVLQLLPLEDAHRHLPVGVPVLRDAPAMIDLLVLIYYSDSFSFPI